MLALVMVAVSLNNPLHLYPLANFIEELLATLGVLVAAAWMLWRADRLRISVWSVLWGCLGGLFFLSSLVHDAAFSSGKLFYLLFWFIGALALLIGEQVDWTDERVSTRIANLLFWACWIGAVGGFLRHFNLLWSGFSYVVPSVPSERMIGLIGQSNFFAYVCLVGLFSSAWLFQQRRLSALMLASGAFFILCLVFTGGRSALVAWIAVAGFLLLRRRLLRVDRFVFVVVAGLFAFAAFKPIAEWINDWLLDLTSQTSLIDERLFSLAGRGMDGSSRLIEWQIALELLRDHPWFGVGVGNYAGQAFAKHVELGIPSSAAALFLHSHSSPLQLLVELGVPGGLWLVALALLGGVHFWRASAQKERILPLCILMAFAVYGLFEFPLWMMPFLVLNLLLLSAMGGRSWSFKLKLGRLFSGVLAAAFFLAVLIYVPLIERFYWSFKQYLVRAPVSAGEYAFMDTLIRDPLMEPYGYLIYTANFQVSPATVPQELDILLRFRSYAPYPQLLARLAFVQVAAGDVAAGVETAAELGLYYGPSITNLNLKEQYSEAKRAFPNVDFSPLLKGHAD